MKINIGDNNLVSYLNWSGLTTGDVIDSGGYWNDYSLGGTVNKRIIGTDPFNSDAVIWQASGSTGSNFYGGFNFLNGQFQYIPIDNTKDYRFSIWVNRQVYNTTKPGDSFFGFFATSGTTTQNVINKQTGVGTTNPYFVNISPAVSNTYLPQDTWRLLVGYLYNKDTLSGSTPKGGLYYIDGTQITGTSAGVYTYDFINSNLVTGATIRIGLPYNSSGYTANYAYPRIDLVDGTEPSINTLLTNEGMWRSGTTYIKVEDQNLLDYSDWSTDLSGDTKDFTASPGFNEMLNQYREQRLDPFNNTNYIWIASGITTTGAGYGGGYVTQKKPIDNTKIYRISQWCNRVNSGGTNNEYYFGFYTYDINNTLTGATRSDGAYSTNYYVYQNISANLRNINGWFLTVGYILPYTMTGNTAAYQGKIYYNGSTHTSNAYNYRFNINAKYLASRSYSPYNSTSFASSHFAYPRIDLVDGTEPSIATLLTNEGMWRSGTTMIYVDNVWKNT